MKEKPSLLVNGTDERVSSYLRFASWPFDSVVENQWAHASQRSPTTPIRRDTTGTIYDWPALLGDREDDLELISETADPNWVVISKLFVDNPSFSDAYSLSKLRGGLYVPRVPHGRTVRIMASPTGEIHLLGYKEIHPSRTTPLTINDRESRTLETNNHSGKWEFLQYNGEQFGNKPAWFENPDYYDRRGARKKFNRDILIEYCERIGLDITNPDFYQGRIAIIDRGRKKG